MMGRTYPGPPVEFEVFGTAVGGGLVAGALSIVAPFLLGLTGTLTALAVAGWARLHARGGRTGSTVLGGRGSLALALLGGGALMFLFPPEGLQAFRGLVLAVSTVPLWWLERARSRRPTRPG